MGMGVGAKKKIKKKSIGKHKSMLSAGIEFQAGEKGWGEWVFKNLSANQKKKLLKTKWPQSQDLKPRC